VVQLESVNDRATAVVQVSSGNFTLAENQVLVAEEYRFWKQTYCFALKSELLWMP
jgi:hypothetical protein